MGCNCGKKKAAAKVKPVTKTPRQIQSKGNKRIIRRVAR